MIAAAEPSEVGPVNTFDEFQYGSKVCSFSQKNNEDFITFLIFIYELLGNIQIKKN
jgi:hypothetical protein